MRAHRAKHSVVMLCRLMEVSTSGYYAWRRREPSARARRATELTVKIKDFHRALRGTYGSPRILADLREAGIRVGCKRKVHTFTCPLKRVDLKHRSMRVQVPVGRAKKV